MKQKVPRQSSEFSKIEPLLFRLCPALAGTTAVLAHCASNGDERRVPMLYYALVFLVVAIIAGVLGFSGIAGTSAGIAQILFFLFLAMLVISLVIRAIRSA
jgi:uncharacterized membrane protein YtjA (UPF0391 family)